MNDLINAALAATASNKGPVIVSEQHDGSQINWVGGMSDPGEMIGCGMYQQLRRQAGESDLAYAARLRVELAKLPTEHRVKIETALRDAAIRRASLDTSNGKVAVMVAGQPAWHGLGVNVDKAVNSAEAIKLAGLNWQVAKIPLGYRHPKTGEPMTAPDRFAVVREDTGAYLGCVGKQYTVFQNEASFAFLDRVVGQFDAKYETAGAIYGGSKVWMLVHLPKKGFAVNGSDRTEAYALFTNAHDGSESAKCFPTSQRVVCANTFRLARKDADNGISMRHTSNLEHRVKAAQDALGIAVQQFDAYKEAAEVLARKPVEPAKYANAVLDRLALSAVLDITTAEQAAKGATNMVKLLDAALLMTDAEKAIKEAEIQRQIDRRRALLEEVLQQYEAPTNGLRDMRGTGWAAFNAVTEVANHGGLLGRQQGDADTRRSRRFESIVNGRADEVMQQAFEVATAMAN